VSGPLANLSKKFGKGPIMFLGNVCLVFSGLVFFLVPNSVMGTWIFIIPYLLIFGIGRGIWVRLIFYFRCDLSNS
jgi:Na+/melibiose symporter-like transporter